MITLLLAAALFTPACVPVEGERVLASDLAKALPAFQALAGDMPVAYAPTAGARRIFRGSALRRLALRYHLELVGDPELCVEVPMAPLKAESLLGAMHESLGSRKARIEIVDYCRFPAPKGAIEFPISALGNPRGRKSPVLWRGVVRYAGGSRRFPIWARVRVEFDLAVASGDTVHVEVHNGAARISMDGRAESGGDVGDTIRVRNPATGRLFFAKVSGKQRAEVLPVRELAR